MVYAVPNDGSRPPLNCPELSGTVALLRRGGGVPLVSKILGAQRCGALGVLLVDDGTCRDEGFEDCGRGGGVKEGGFAGTDEKEAWREVEIPALLVTRASGQRLDNLMTITAVDIPGLGTQYVTILP